MLEDLAMGPVKAVVGKIIECVDVDGVVRQIDVNSLLERVDMNILLEQIDWDQHLDRIDFDRHIQRVDINRLVQRSDLGYIVAQSTNGIFVDILDALRKQLVVVDFWLRRFISLKWRHEAKVRLPPKPGKNQTTTSLRGGDRVTTYSTVDAASPQRSPQVEAQLANDPSSSQYYPRRRSEMAIAVQGRCCGFFSKAVAIFIDVAFVTLSFMFFILIIEACWILFVGTSLSAAKENVNKDNKWGIVLYCMYWFIHFFLGVLLTGRTIGMYICGLKVVRFDKGKELKFQKALIRTALLPISLSVLPFLGLIGFVRPDGRMLHDLVAGSSMVYNWNAKMAKMRQRAARLVDPDSSGSVASCDESTSLVAPSEVLSDDD